MEPASLKILRFGTKEIYLPKFTISLMRTPNLSPYHAKFKVPLNFSKFDLRDYLFHAYNVRAVQIRSSIKHSPVRDHESARRTWFRDEQQKFMVIEMDRPFVWPQEPDSYKPWGKDEKEENVNKAVNERLETDEKVVEAAQRLRMQALGMLKGKGWEEHRQEVLVEEPEKPYKIRV